MKIDFPKRVRFETVLVAALMLGSCNYHSPRETWERAEIADVNARNALDRISALEGRIEDIESRLGN